MRSMTGFGSSVQDAGGRALHVDVRSVNHRYLKLVVKLPPSLERLETEISEVVNRAATRGTITVSVSEQSRTTPGRARLNSEVAEGWYREIIGLRERLGLPLQTSDSTALLPSLLTLPGVMVNDWEEETEEPRRAAVLRATEAAVQAWNATRSIEGRALLSALEAELAQVRRHFVRVMARAPKIVTELRDRLIHRVTALRQELGEFPPLGESELAREVCLLADRTDISEELARLNAHLDAFSAGLSGEGPHGRRLEFLLQEMLRETNTLGAKANDAEIAQAVIEIKCAIERLKEQVMNLE